MEDLIAVLERPKRLIKPFPWVSPSQNGRRGLKLQTSLRDDTASLQGVKLEIGCSSEGFDLPVRVVLLAEINKKARAIARIDINGSMHQNRPAICGESQFMDAGRTHFHDTRMHRTIPIAELFNGSYDLPIARPIDDMPEDFTKAMEKCGELLHIENLVEIEEPQWQPRQFPL